MIPFHFIFFFAFCIYLCLAQSVLAQTNLRGMQTGEDFRVGPVIRTGLPLFISQTGDRQMYQLTLQGESPNHGYSHLFLRSISLYELLNIPVLNSTQTSAGKDVRFHHQFVTLGFASPILYELTSPMDFEFGWATGFSITKVTFKEPQKANPGDFLSQIMDYPEIKPTQLGAQDKTNAAQADTQFIGGEFGVYGRYYGWYPLVPHISGLFNLGAYFDINSFLNGTTSTTGTGSNQTVQATRVFQPGFSFSPIGSIGLDYYLGSRGLIGLELMFWNWNFMQRSQDNTLFLNLKAGFLF